MSVSEGEGASDKGWLFCRFLNIPSRFDGLLVREWKGKR